MNEELERKMKLKMGQSVFPIVVRERKEGRAGGGGSVPYCN
jgi:hypothetical protein